MRKGLAAVVLVSIIISLAYCLSRPKLLCPIVVTWDEIPLEEAHRDKFIAVSLDGRVLSL